jgi:RHS repeat-associated protein
MRSAYDQNRGKVYFPAWHGTLIQNKRDGSGLEYKRNRVYDPVTGRFAQEDPIVLAGGLNSYSFANSDPTNLADPFGLRVCFQGSAADVTQLKEAAETASGTRITLDKANCIVKADPTGGSGYAELQNTLFDLVRSDKTVYLRWVEPLGGPGDRTTARRAAFTVVGGVPFVEIGRNVLSSQRYRATRFLGFCLPFKTAPSSLAALVAHEFLGHAGYWINNRGMVPPEDDAVRIENLYHAAAGERLRCGY